MNVKQLWCVGMLLLGVGCAQGPTQTLLSGKDRCVANEDCNDGLTCVDGRCVVPGSSSSSGGVGPLPNEQVRYLVVMESSDSLDLTDPTLERFRALRGLVDAHRNDNLARFRLVVVNEYYRTWPVEPRFLPANELSLEVLDDPGSTLRELRYEPDLQNGLDGITQLLRQDMAANGAPKAYRVLLFMDGSWGWACCRCSAETDINGNAPLQCFSETPVFPDQSSYFSPRFCDGLVEFQLCNVEAGNPSVTGTIGEMATERIRLGNYSRVVQLEYRVNSLWHEVDLAGASFRLDVVWLTNTQAPAQTATPVSIPATPELTRSRLGALAAAGGGELHEVETAAALDFAGIWTGPPVETVPPARQENPFPGCAEAPCPWSSRCNMETYACEATCGAVDAPTACGVNQVCDIEANQCVPDCDVTPSQCGAGRTCLAGTGQCLTDCIDGLCMRLGKMCAQQGMECVPPLEATGCSFVADHGLPAADPRGPLMRIATVDGTPYLDETNCQAGERSLIVQVQYHDATADMSPLGMCNINDGVPAMVIYDDASPEGFVGRPGCKSPNEVATPSTGESGVVNVIVCTSLANPPTIMVAQIRDMANNLSNPVCFTPPENGN